MDEKKVYLEIFLKEYFSLFRDIWRSVVYRSLICLKITPRTGSRICDSVCITRQLFCCSSHRSICHSAFSGLSKVKNQSDCSMVSMVSMVSPHEATNRPHTMATVFVLRKAGLRADGRIFTVHVKTELHVTQSQTLWPYDQVRQISLSSTRAYTRRAKPGISVRHTG
jgi:hypothetical protein